MIPRRYACWLCRKRDKIDERATVRIFSGIGASGFIGAGGFPTCAMHEHETTTEALKVFDAKVKGPISDDYEVTAYVVNWNDPSMPMLGRMLWRATRKAKAA